MEENVVHVEAWAEHVLSIAAERFESRLSGEIASLRVDLSREIHAGFAALRKEAADHRVELLKWCLLFWIGQFAAVAAVLSFMLRGR